MGRPKQIIPSSQVRHSKRQPWNRQQIIQLSWKIMGSHFGEIKGGALEQYFRFPYFSRDSDVLPHAGLPRQEIQTYLEYLSPTALSFCLVFMGIE